MTHMPRNERETSHQTALVGKQEGIRHFPLKLLEKIRSDHTFMKKDMISDNKL